MKKILLLFAAVAAVAFTGCSKDDENSFKYGMDAIYGKWTSTAIKSDGNWIDVSDPLFAKYRVSATFNSDGTYYGEGALGTGSGTYKAKGDTITTYVDGKEYGRYKIHSLSNNLAEMTITIDGESIDIKCQKQ